MAVYCACFVWLGLSIDAVCNEGGWCCPACSCGRSLNGVLASSKVTNVILEISIVVVDVGKPVFENVY